MQQSGGYVNKIGDFKIGSLIMKGWPTSSMTRLRKTVERMESTLKIFCSSKKTAP